MKPARELMRQISIIDCRHPNNLTWEIREYYDSSSLLIDFIKSEVSGDRKIRMKFAHP